MKKINIGVIGTGWHGGIRSEACVASPCVNGLYITVYIALESVPPEMAR